MTTHAGFIEREGRRPARTILVPPSAFSDTWPDRPKEPVCIGLRTLSVADQQAARGEAAKLAIQAVDVADDAARVEAYNEALVTWIVAHATCDPNDVAIQHELWQGIADDVVPMALTSEGARLIFNGIDALARETESIGEATDEEIDGLHAAWTAGKDKLRPEVAARLRRLATMILTELAA